MCLTRGEKGMCEKVKCPVSAGLAEWADIGSFSEYLRFRKSSANDRGAFPNRQGENHRPSAQLIERCKLRSLAKRQSVMVRQVFETRQSAENSECVGC